MTGAKFRESEKKKRFVKIRIAKLLWAALLAADNKFNAISNLRAGDTASNEVMRANIKNKGEPGGCGTCNWLGSGNKLATIPKANGWLECKNVRH